MNLGPANKSIAFVGFQETQLVGRETNLHWREQNGLRHCRLQAVTLRLNRERDEEYDGQGRLEGGFH